MNNAKHTPERLAILRETWGTDVRIAEIMRRLNDTPGSLPVTGKQAAAWAARMGISRGAGSRRAVLPEIIAQAPGREPVLRHLANRATGAWSYPRLERLCDEWERGTSGDQIAAMLGVSKNAVLGKVHRLAKRGLLSARPAAIVPRKGERKPPVTRPMNIPPPLVTLPARTLPPLLSGLPPLLSHERIYDGPPGFHFATGRPPLPVTRTWIADDGASPTGPATRGCQFVVREGSVTEPWIHCGLPAARGAWCTEHRAIVYFRARAA